VVFSRFRRSNFGKSNILGINSCFRGERTTARLACASDQRAPIDHDGRFLSHAGPRKLPKIGHEKTECRYYGGADLPEADAAKYENGPENAEEPAHELVAFILHLLESIFSHESQLIQGSFSLQRWKLIQAFRGSLMDSEKTAPNVTTFVWDMNEIDTVLAVIPVQSSKARLECGISGPEVSAPLTHNITSQGAISS
jgi:hypothetical protein